MHPRGPVRRSPHLSEAGRRGTGSVALATLLLLVACDSAEPPPATAAPGDALPGLSEAQLARFAAGRALFDRDFTEAEGLGPLFNQRRCSSCHDLPTPGGSGSETVLKATRFQPPDRCDTFAARGGDMLQQQVTPTLAALGFAGERAPHGADGVVMLSGPPLYGLGLIEAIPADDIVAHEDPDDRDGDGVRGRAVRGPDGSLLRFGRKASFTSVRSFVEHALLHEMGLTSAAFPEELRHQGMVLPAETDPATDPEIDDATVALLVDYVRFLALPAPERPAFPATADSIRTGEHVFGDVGCADCHTPTMRTSPAAEPGLAGHAVALYSDLLLHDLGEELASICTPAAAPSEWRTAPLAGARHRQSFLHDGRAQSLRAAIAAHGGEAAHARERFAALDPASAAMLLRFIASL